jgi:PPOX class probable F420-dependent enzyme
MISSNPAYEKFIDDHRWAVITTLRKSGSPVSSVVAYARYLDKLVVSTPGATFKRASLEKDSRVNLCIVSNSEPFNFVAIEGTAEVSKRDLVQKTKLVFKKITDMYEEPNPIEKWLDEQDRVIIEISASRVSGVIR